MFRKQFKIVSVQSVSLHSSQFQVIFVTQYEMQILMGLQNPLHSKLHSELKQ